MSDINQVSQRPQPHQPSDDMPLGWANLPPGLTIQTEEDKIAISYAWYNQKYIVSALIALAWNGSFLFLSDIVSVLIYFLLPFGWIGIALAYYSLAGLLNITTVTITPAQLTLNHAPIPYFPCSIKVDINEIKQLYVERKHKFNSKDNDATYQLRLITTSGRDIALLSSLKTKQYAAYLEQYLESYLDIKDELIKNELNKGYTTMFGSFWDIWQAFAEKHNFKVTTGKYLEAHSMYGYYREYLFRLIPQEGKIGGTRFRTYLEMIRQPPDSHPVLNDHSNNQPASMVTPADVTGIFTVKEPIKGKFTVKENGYTLVYEQVGFETDEPYLKYIFDMTADLLDIYPDIVTLGGLAIEPLISMATKKDSSLPISLNLIKAGKDHPLRLVAVDLLTRIAQQSIQLHEQKPDLVCQQCLRYYTVDSIAISAVEKLTCFSCRICHATRSFYEAKQVIAVLDETMAGDLKRRGKVLWVNWLKCQTLFDFDTVKIVASSDEAIERFVVQIGNNLDLFWKVKPHEMTCFISAEYTLSSTAERMLTQTFAKSGNKLRR